MQRLLSHDTIPDSLRGGVIALGNFDGFHAGHQAVVEQAKALAADLGGPLIVATFDPHPVLYFKPDAPHFRLTNVAQRERLFADAGADAMLVLEFDAAMAATSAEDFVDRLLVDRFGAAGTVTGNNFTYGKDRRGDVTTLRAAADAGKFAYRMATPVLTDDAEMVSSTLIRDALRAGDMAAATRMLTRPFAVEGVVQHGDKVGRELGFPTANIDMGDYLRPRYGVYAVTGKLEDGRVLKGAANLGVRPHFDPPKELLEPHFFDFSGDLYGQTVEIAFHAYLRGEEKFDGLDALIAQIDKDCDEARAVLA
jgi:riboflavin kinase/FMN adenylyltransferase